MPEDFMLKYDPFCHQIDAREVASTILEYEILVAIVRLDVPQPLIWVLDAYETKNHDYELPNVAEITEASNEFVAIDKSLDYDWYYEVKRLMPEPEPEPVKRLPPEQTYVNGKLYYCAYPYETHKSTGIIGEQILVITNAEFDRIEAWGGDLGHWGHAQMLGGVWGYAPDRILDRPRRYFGAHVVMRNRYFFDTEALPPGNWIATTLEINEALVPRKETL